MAQYPDQQLLEQYTNSWQNELKKQLPTLVPWHVRRRIEQNLRRLWKLGRSPSL
jgi:hypothetical protein